jgi:hypothetical protein
MENAAYIPNCALQSGRNFCSFLHQMGTEGKYEMETRLNSVIECTLHSCEEYVLPILCEINFSKYIYIYFILVMKTPYTQDRIETVNLNRFALRIYTLSTDAE